MLIADPDVDPVGLLACQSLDTNREWDLIRYFATVDSTNTAALQDIGRSGLPRLYLADTQTAGRGRQGRGWVADSGTLTYSLVVPATKDAAVPPVSITVGVAMARAIEHLAAPFAAKLKWPNDVYLDHRKVAGILVEATPSNADAVVIGVGLNVATDFGQQGIMSDVAPVSICELTQRYPHRYQWLQECVGQVLDAIEESIEFPQGIIQEHRRRCLLTGKPIRYMANGQWLTGQCEGIDDSGALVVRVGQELQRLRSGEVQQCRL
jgi:BirA family biotin operon repressor/biotin-[acetyl-CoA-carboxylase] ligase